MPSLHADGAGILIGLTSPDVTLPNAVTTMTFDLRGNEALVTDIQAHADQYRLLPGPLLQKDGATVTVDTAPAPTGIRRAIQILTDQETAIASATTIAQVRVILEQNRVILRRLLIMLGEDVY